MTLFYHTTANGLGLGCISKSRELTFEVTFLGLTARGDWRIKDNRSSTLAHWVLSATMQDGFQFRNGEDAMPPGDLRSGNLPLAV